jgi:protein involved in sex pheromone biosynthesis
MEILQDVPAEDKQDCDQLKEFKKECKDFFKNLVGGKT